MFKMIGAALAAVALSCAGAAGAAQVITFGPDDFPDFQERLVWSGWNAPASGQRAQVTIRWNDVALGDDSIIYGDYFGDYYWWDVVTQRTEGNDIYAGAYCSIRDGCIQRTSVNSAVAYFEAPRIVGRMENCQPGAPNPCYIDYGSAGNALVDIVAQRTGENPWIEITIGDFAPVPEPHTWALMIMGFGFAGSMLRRLRRDVEADIDAGQRAALA